jgi:hypothetical protein
MPASICLIRHAEKQLGEGPPHGVLIDGTPDPESLVPRGWQRAGALVGLFAPRADEPGPPRLPVPTHLFASEVGPHSHSRRPLETLQPLSERLGLPLDEPLMQDELDRLVQAIRGCGGDVLVAWEHKRIPLIANLLLGAPSTVPQVWPDDRFDLIWLLQPDPPDGGPLRLRQVPQLLLAGDRSEPIA